ncbi:MAG: PEP-CTERM sorting domain-containing protein [Deltaproteobacteria bacterium]|nr:PEP-CTERM sorting domain-containing protein [Deltaproteobacteria bacterium]
MIPVPEPESFGMMLVGLTGLAFSGRRRSRGREH